MAENDWSLAQNKWLNLAEFCWKWLNLAEMAEIQQIQRFSANFCRFQPKLSHCQLNFSHFQTFWLNMAEFDWKWLGWTLAEFGWILFGASGYKCAAPSRSPCGTTSMWAQVSDAPQGEKDNRCETRHSAWHPAHSALMGQQRLWTVKKKVKKRVLLLTCPREQDNKIQTFTIVLLHRSRDPWYQLIQPFPCRPSSAVFRTTWWVGWAVWSINRMGAYGWLLDQQVKDDCDRTTGIPGQRSNSTPTSCSISSPRSSLGTC